ncbi:MAG: hypothetical protein AB2792_09490 [Candidatus Thiodiazotropha sp.]
MNKDYASTEKVLGEPVFIELSDYARRVKNSLVFCSILGIGLSFTSILVSKESTIFGIRLENLNHTHILILLLLLVGYLCFHYIWVIVDNFMEWRLRITGTKTTFVTAGTFGSKEADYPTDPRQSTLYNWWRQQQRTLSLLYDTIKKIESIERKLLEDSKQYPDNAVDIQGSLMELNKELITFKQNVQQIEGVTTTERIPVSLKRFDGWYKLFLKSQNARWFLFDFLFPLALSVIAFYGLYENL